MWEVWLIIAFAVAMVVGPVMMLQPSEGTSRLAKLRGTANQKGVQIRLPHHEDGKKIYGAIYGLPLTQKMRKKKIGTWVLEKQNSAHEIHFHERWHWRDGSCADANILEILPQILDDLPEGVTRLQCNDSGIGILWDERTHGQTEEIAVTKIIQTLEYVLQKIDSVL